MMFILDSNNWFKGCCQTNTAPHMLENRKRGWIWSPSTETGVFMAPRGSFGLMGPNYCLGSDSMKLVWKKLQRNFKRDFKIDLYSVPSSCKEDYWWCESVSQISWAHNEWTLERWVCSCYLIPVHPLRLLYQPNKWVEWQGLWGEIIWRWLPEVLESSEKWLKWIFMMLRMGQSMQTVLNQENHKWG